MKKTKLIHLGIIILGIIFVFIPAFHSNIWFDESYSVAIAGKSFGDIWTITGHDVHPALYYWMLHIIYLIFGSNILIYRLFSVLSIAILGIIGYTHIRKDFGEKTGIVFSFLTYFLPIMNTYAQEIRMYSWTCLIVTLMAIYGYRFYKAVKENSEKNKIKNLCLFGIFSICSCYIHYYALVTAGLINLIILIYLIKNRKNDVKSLRNFLIVAVIQVILYIPWMIFFVVQLKHVGGGFWIQLSLVGTTVDILSFQFKNQVDSNFLTDIKAMMALIVSILVYVYSIIKAYKLKKDGEDIKPIILSAGIYVGVILIILLVSMISPILYARYLLTMTGLYIFTLAFIISKEKNKIISGIILAITLILAVLSNIQNVKENYNKENMDVYNYINDELEEDDIFLYSKIGNGGMIATYFPKNKQYFMNLEHWGVEEAYKAYLPAMETKENWDFLKDFKGRIWLIDDDSNQFYENEEFHGENINVLKEEKQFKIKYHNLTYNVILIEKN